MTTLASPTQGATERLSLWRVQMAAGRSGPRHVFDSEQVWTVLAGAVEIDADDATTTLRGGDTAVIPGGVERRITALDDVQLIVCGFGDAIASVPGEPAPRGTPAWIA
jgi:quercetin dioxygenase-like cupin family protein